MRTMLAVVRRDVFEGESIRVLGRIGGLGDVLDWSKYVSGNPRLKKLHAGDSLLLVTARPDGELWVCAFYEGIRWNPEGYWMAGKKNSVRVSQITRLGPRLRFVDRKPILMVRGRTGQSLQTPGILDAASIHRVMRALQ